tara:strand:+ start:22 stop:486 length:465 start_codon:yes stop_codon:yes gene_type:complete
MHFIFDLDETVIDSSHRQGETLDEWIALNTRDNILKDTLLPLADQMKAAYHNGDVVTVCTSRVLSAHDFESFRLLGLRFDNLLARTLLDGNEAPGSLKLRLLQGMAKRQNISWTQFCRTAIMFDDNSDVKETLNRNGLKCFCPVNYNSRNKKAA